MATSQWNVVIERNEKYLQLKYPDGNIPAEEEEWYDAIADEVEEMEIKYDVYRKEDKEKEAKVEVRETQRKAKEMKIREDKVGVRKGTAVIQV